MKLDLNKIVEDAKAKIEAQKQAQEASATAAVMTIPEINPQLTEFITYISDLSFVSPAIVYVMSKTFIILSVIGAIIPWALHLDHPILSTLLAILPLYSMVLFYKSSKLVGSKNFDIIMDKWIELGKQ